MLRRVNPDEETIDWRAVCGRTARTVRRAGRAQALPDPYQCLLSAVRKTLLKTPIPRPALLPRKRQELHVYLHVTATNLLLLTVRVYDTSSGSVRNPGHAMPLADPTDRYTRSLDAVIPLQVPGNSGLSLDLL